MNKFKVGDIVQVTTPSSDYYGCTGVVLNKADDLLELHLDSDEPPLWFNYEGVTLISEAKPTKTLKLHYFTAIYKAAILYVYRNNLVDGKPVYTSYLAAQEQLDELVVESTKSGMIATGGFIVMANKVGDDEYYVDIYVNPCFGEYNSFTTLEVEL